MYDAIIENKPDSLTKLDAKFGNLFKQFLLTWGGKLQTVLKKDYKINFSTSLIERGLFKKTLSKILQKKFKLPVSIEKLPEMLDGLQKLPDIDLIELIKGYISNDSDLKKLFKVEVFESLLNDTGSTLVDELENFMLDAKFLSANFENSLEHYPKNKGTLELKNSWRKFSEAIVSLWQSKNFSEAFKKRWKDNDIMGFQKQLTAIAFNPDVYKHYDLLTIFVSFNSKNLSDVDEELIIEKTRFFVATVYDRPNQVAAIRAREGNYTVKPLNIHSGPEAKYTHPMEDFGANGMLINSKGEKIPYYKALVIIDSSFINFNEKKGKDKNESIVSNPSEKMLETSKQVLEKEVDDLVSFLESYAATEEEQKDLWQFVRELALSAKDKKQINTCSKKINELEKKIYKKKEREKEILEAVLKPTVNSLMECISTLPKGNVQDFLKWVLTSKQFSKDYLQLMSITQTAALEGALFGKLLSKDILLKVLPELGILNVYFAAEAWTDNLETKRQIKEQDPKEQDLYDQSKRIALSKFNNVMIKTLTNSSPEELVPQDFEKFSICQHCLSPEEMDKFIEAYQKDCRRDVRKDIEYSYYFMVKMNINSAQTLLEKVKNHKLFNIIQKSLIERYSSVDQLLQDKDLPLKELLEFGRQSILVTFTLAFCIAVLDQVKPNPKLEEVIKDNSLETALNTAALLVRLTNDIGTIPLLNPVQSLKNLDAYINSNSGSNLDHKDFFTIMEDAWVMEGTLVEWSRAIKDIKFGEHNVGLDSVRKQNNMSETLGAFKSNVLELSKIYLEKRNELIEAIKIINQKLGNEVVGNLILNFVLFHEKLYKKDARTQEGEYAIKSGQ